jgi:hypothetical protein
MARPRVPVAQPACPRGHVDGLIYLHGQALGGTVTTVVRATRAFAKLTPQSSAGMWIGSR